MDIARLTAETLSEATTAPFGGGLTNAAAIEAASDDLILAKN